MAAEVAAGQLPLHQCRCPAVLLGTDRIRPPVGWASEWANLGGLGLAPRIDEQRVAEVGCSLVALLLLNDGWIDRCASLVVRRRFAQNGDEWDCSQRPAGIPSTRTSSEGRRRGTNRKTGVVVLLLLMAPVGDDDEGDEVEAYERKLSGGSLADASKPEHGLHTAVQVPLGSLVQQQKPT